MSTLRERRIYERMANTLPRHQVDETLAWLKAQCMRHPDFWWAHVAVAMRRVLGEPFPLSEW